MLIINNWKTFRPGTPEILIQRAKNHKKPQGTEGTWKEILIGHQCPDYLTVITPSEAGRVKEIVDSILDMLREIYLESSSEKRIFPDTFRWRES